MLTAVVFNEGSVSAADPNNPTGFILGGTATLVPLPPTAWMGLASLGALGLLRLRKRRRS